MGAFGAFVFPVFMALVNREIPLDAHEIAILAGVEGFGGVAAAATAPWWIYRFSWRTIAIAASLALLCGTFLTMMATSFETLFAVRLGTSFFGAGPAASLGIAALSRTRFPDRSFGYGGAMQAIVPSAVMFAASFSMFATADRFLMLLAGIYAAAIPLFLALPGHRHEPAETGPRARLGGRAGAIMLCVLAIAGCFQGYWAFSERVGHAVFSAQTLPTLLSLSFFMSFTAGLVPALVAGRWPRTWIFYTTTALLAVTLAPVAIVNTQWTFAASVFGLNFVTVLLNAIGLGALADIDRTGRLAATAPVFSSIGLMLGPISAAPLIAGGHYELSAFVAIAFGLLAAVAFHIAVRGPGRAPHSLATAQHGTHND
jgi:hypothetical protein